MNQNPSASHHGLRSMTGFSSVDGHFNQQRLRVEIKGVNHRFQDLKIRLPKDLASLEPLIRRDLSPILGRGSIELRVDLSSETDSKVAPEIDLELAERYVDQLRELARRTGAKAEFSTVELLSLPEMLRSPDENATAVPAPDLWEEIRGPFLKAVDEFKASRLEEGTKLVRQLDEQKTELQRLSGIARDRRSKIEEAFPVRIREKISRLFEQYPIQDAPTQSVLESRISQELAAILDRTDVEEELTRLEGHLEKLGDLLNDTSPVGRKLDFTLQEIHREITTLGSKAQDFELGETVVAMKVANEQIREQVLNIE